MNKIKHLIKHVVITFVIFNILSCSTNERYCHVCEIKILEINKELKTTCEYYNHIHFGAITFGASDYEIHHIKKIEQRISDLLNKREYYELEIVKNSKNWKFSEETIQSYNDLIQKQNGN